MPGRTKAFRARPGLALPAVEAVLEIDGVLVGKTPVNAAMVFAEINAEIAAESREAKAYFILEDGSQIGAYYMRVQ